jgi:hypothetical protein
MSFNTVHGEPETLERLLAMIRKELSQDPLNTPDQVTNRVAYLATAANYLTRYLGKTRDRIEIGEIAGIDDDFKQYLKGLNLAKGNVVSIVSAFRALLHLASDFGWSPQLLAVDYEWERGRQALYGFPGGPSIVKDALARKISVSNYSEKHPDDWVKRTIAEGRAYTYVRWAQLAFCRVLRSSGLGKLFSRLDLRPRSNHSVRLRLDTMPSSLREEIEAIIERMRDEVKRGVIRMKSVESTVAARFEKFCGYGVYVKSMEPPAQLRSLLTSKYINEYAIWLNDTAKCQRQTISHRLGILSNAHCLYPELATLVRGLFRNAVNQIPKDKESSRKRRRRAREVHHRALARIVEEMHRERANRTDLTPEAQAWFCHDELLMQLLTWYPWYTSCLCTCRFTGSSLNHFKHQLPVDGRPFALTPEARAQHDADPCVEFWQFSFSGEETPNRLPASGL